MCDQRAVYGKPGRFDADNFAATAKALVVSNQVAGECEGCAVLPPDPESRSALTSHSVTGMTQFGPGGVIHADIVIHLKADAERKASVCAGTLPASKKHRFTHGLGLGAMTDSLNIVTVRPNDEGRIVIA